MKPHTSPIAQFISEHKHFFIMCHIYGQWNIDGP